MLKTAFEAASCLLFPKVCETCPELLPARDRRGVCARCEASLLMIKSPFCVLCGRTSPRENARCGQCRDTGFHFDRVYAVVYYDGKARELLQAFKFGLRFPLKTFFSELLTGFITTHLDTNTIDAVVSVPMSTHKEKERGFNQARLLSHAVAGKTKKQDLSGSLKKKKPGLTQSALNKTERARNIENSFFVKDSHVFSGKRILLVDDILTTGFTASECAKTLKNAGAASVTALAVARGL